MTRIVALGAALVITAAVIVFAEFGGLYITNKAEIAGRPKPQEYIINLQPPPAHKVP
ncbi:MAG: hypothetical protein ABSD74_15550 [Rhizomicrobium sp.]